MSERKQCERCKEWERLGLSRYCPSCDAIWLEHEHPMAKVKALSKWINIAHKKDVPSLVNIDHIARIYPGGQSGNGKDMACTIVFGFSIEFELEQRGDTMVEEYFVEVFLPITEIIRRMKEELLVI